MVVAKRLVRQCVAKRPCGLCGIGQFKTQPALPREETSGLVPIYVERQLQSVWRVWDWPIQDPECTPEGGDFRFGSHLMWKESGNVGSECDCAKGGLSPLPASVYGLRIRVREVHAGAGILPPPRRKTMVVK